MKYFDLSQSASTEGGDPIVATLNPTIRNDSDGLSNFSKNGNHDSSLALSSRQFAVTFFYLPYWSIIRP